MAAYVALVVHTYGEDKIPRAARSLIRSLDHNQQGPDRRGERRETDKDLLSKPDPHRKRLAVVYTYIGVLYIYWYVAYSSRCIGWYTYQVYIYISIQSSVSQSVRVSALPVFLLRT